MPSIIAQGNHVEHTSGIVIAIRWKGIDYPLESRGNLLIKLDGRPAGLVPGTIEVLPLVESTEAEMETRLNRGVWCHFGKAHGELALVSTS